MGWPTIPAGATITAATMKVNLMAGTSTAANAKAYQVNGSWESATIQWSNMPGNGALLEDSISHNNKTKYEFSCLTAVRHWYDGSTTGQNENYGIMLQYADSTIADYNSFYSADCADATMRPSMTISYQLMVVPMNQISVQEGYLAQLPLPNITGTITWTSADENVATVNSNGGVTGIKAGKVTVTASVEDVAEYTYTVYVKIKEGAHRIYRANASYYLSVGGGMLENAGIYLKNASDADLSLYRQVWKIYYLEQGYYVIRPLHNQNMALYAKDGVCSVTTIGSSNYLIQVPEENRWTIEWVGGGYVFKCQGDSSQTLRSLYNAPDVRVYTGEYMSSNNVFQWNFSDSPDIQPEVLLLNSKTGEKAPSIIHGILPQQSTTLSDFGITPVFVCATKYIQDPRWSSSASSLIYVNETTGTFKGYTIGKTAAVTVIYTAGYDEYSETVPLVVVPFTEGTFYIKSSADEKYLQVVNGDSENYDCTSGAEMVQWHFTGDSNQRWIFTLQNDGYFSIISAKIGLALSVPFAQWAEVDVTLRQLPYEGNSSQKWRIVETAAHGYKIVPQSALGQSKDLAIALAVTVISMGDGTQIQQREYVPDGDLRDEWLICSMVNIGMSTDDYTGAGDRQRKSYIYANTFFDHLMGIYNGPFTCIHHYNSGSVYSASKEDFAVNGAMSNEIDFMIYIGHGHSATNCGNSARQNHIQYSRASDGTVSVASVCDAGGAEQNEKDKYCVYTDKVKFGSRESDLRWVWMYTCNFLNTNDYVSYDDLKQMMTGVHIILGYETTSYLCNANSRRFGQLLEDGETIIRSFFKAGSEGESTETEDNHIQKVLYIPQAVHETIYSTNIRYEYDSSDILSVSHNIQLPY